MVFGEYEAREKRDNLRKKMVLKVVGRKSAWIYPMQCTVPDLSDNHFFIEIQVHICRDIYRYGERFIHQYRHRKFDRGTTTRLRYEEYEYFVSQGADTEPPELTVSYTAHCMI